LKVTNFDQITEVVKGMNRRVVIPMANNEEAQTAVKMAHEKVWVSGGTLIGDKKAIEDIAKQTGLELKDFDILDIGNPAEAAREAVRLMKEEKGDFLLKGIIDTKDYMRAILDKGFQMVEPGKLLSHVVVMQVPGYHKLLGITDVAISITPGADEMKKIIDNIVDVFHRLGIHKPKVAMICPVEKVNPKIPSTLIAQEMVEHFRGSDSCVVEGPYDTYIALSKHAAEEKGVSGEVCGDADILVFPNLDSGNPVYKIMNQFIPDIQSAAIIAGAKIPAILPSRADSAETKMLSIALSAFICGERCLEHPVEK
jgi:phosphate butyryltransferase